MEAVEVPHFHNQVGVARVRIGVKEFMCIGALPPSDHPHVFLDMGDENEMICPYCSTRFVFDATLGDDCDPPECAYTSERKTDFSDPRPVGFDPAAAVLATPPPARTAVSPRLDLSPQGRGLVASFACEEAVSTAIRELRNDHYELHSFAPTIPEHAYVGSCLPTAMLIGGLVGAFGGFAMESYANIVGYPLDIGGRPEFSWPSFVPIAFEIGALLAVLTGIVGYIFAAGLFKLHDPVDERRPMRRAMRDAWVVSVHAQDLAHRELALEILLGLGAQDLEEIGS
jgi:uncharacterized Zn-finger protein